MLVLRSFAVALCLSLLLVTSALGEKTTVSGTGDLKKMFVDNARSELVVKLYGFDKPCQARSFNIDAFWGKKAAYQVEAACYGGTDWSSGLYYTSNRNGGLQGKRVKCKGFKLKFEARGKVWRAVIPRSCMPKAPDRIRVKSEGINYTGSAMPAQAGPTRLLRRG